MPKKAPKIPKAAKSAAQDNNRNTALELSPWNSNPHRTNKTTQRDHRKAVRKGTAFAKAKAKETTAQKARRLAKYKPREIQLKPSDPNDVLGYLDWVEYVVSPQRNVVTVTKKENAENKVKVYQVGKLLQSLCQAKNNGDKNYVGPEVLWAAVARFRSVLGECGVMNGIESLEYDEVIAVARLLKRTGLLVDEWDEHRREVMKILDNNDGVRGHIAVSRVDMSGRGALRELDAILDNMCEASRELSFFSGKVSRNMLPQVFPSGGRSKER